MHTYRITAVERRNDHIILKMRPKSVSDRLKFLPGQYATISFRKGVRLSPARCFSMTNSPRSDELHFAMRPDGKFTSQLAELAEGSTIQVRGPFGSFTIDPSFDKSIVMLAGGIGITPFMSMLRHAASTRLPMPIRLLYSVRDTNNIPFYNELLELQNQLPDFEVAFLASSGQSDTSRGIFNRRLDYQTLANATGNAFEGYSFFICGPKNYMKNAASILEHEGVEPDYIITEAFSQSEGFSWKPKMGVPSLTYALTALGLLAGVGFFMALDLVRYVPKIQATSAKLAPTVSTPTTTQDDYGSYTDNSATQQTSPSATTQTQQSTGASSYANTYQAPVSTVS